MKKEKYFLHAGEKRLNFKIAIITGACRSGKSLIGKLLGSLENVEYMEEPWLPTVLPVLQGNNLIDPEVSKNILRSYIDELMNDVVLLRQSNFRPRDLSTIWDRKNVMEIFDRLVNLHTREDVKKYLNKKKTVLLLNLPGIMPFLFFFAETFPGCKIIHIVRNGLDVALEVRKKKWFTNKLLKQPISNYLLFRSYYSKAYCKNYNIPWWVKKGEEDKFLKMTNFAKGLYYWRRILEISENQIEKFKSVFPGQYKEVRFENILKNPEVVLNNLSGFFNAGITEKTNLVLSEIDAKMLKTKKRYPLNEVPNDEKIKVKKLLIKLKYPANV